MKLTEEEALFYIQNKLKITFPESNWTDEFKRDKWGVLKNIYKSYLQKNYFQSISLLINQSEPTRESSVKACIEGIGGVCIDNNYSLATLLNALGYDAYAASSAFLLDKNPDNHVFCIVPGDSEGELWALDAGCSQVFHEILPLHAVKSGEKFSLPSGGFEVQFRHDKETDNFQRVDLGGDYYHGKFENEGERICANLSVIPREHEHFKNTMKIFFTDTEKSFLINIGIALSRYVELNEDGSFKFLAIWGLKYFMVTNDSVERKIFDNYEEMWPTVKSYFPLVKKNDYDLAAKTHLECKKIDVM